MESIDFLLCSKSKNDRYLLLNKSQILISVPYFFRSVPIKTTLANIHYLHYPTSNSNIELLANFKDQTIISDSRLNCSAHTEKIKNKAMHSLGFIKRN